MISDIDTANIDARTCPIKIEQPPTLSDNIEQRNKTSQTIVAKAFESALSSLPKQLREIVTLKIKKDTEENPGSDEFGFNSMTALCTVISKHITLEQMQTSEFQDLMKTLLGYYILENITDDLGIVNMQMDGTLKYPHRELLSEFFIVMIDLAYGIRTLEDSIDRIATVQTGEIQTKITPVAKKLEAKKEVLTAFGVDPASFEDPATRLLFENSTQFVLQENIRAVHAIVVKMRDLEMKFPELKPFIDEAIKGIIIRYQGCLEQLDNPNMQFQDALKVSSETILTQLHTPYTLLSLASQREDLRAELANPEKADFYRQLIVQSNIVNRILNECGIAAFRPQEVMDVFATDPRFEPFKTVRGLVNALRKALEKGDNKIIIVLASEITTKTVDRESSRLFDIINAALNTGNSKLFARLFKDVLEREASVALDSPVEGNALQRLRSNLNSASIELANALKKIEELIVQTGNSPLASSIVEFIVFENIMYSNGGEYTNDKKHDSSLILQNAQEAVYQDHSALDNMRIIGEVQLLEL